VTFTRAGAIGAYSICLPGQWKEVPVSNAKSGNYCQPRCDEVSQAQISPATLTYKVGDHGGSICKCTFRQCSDYYHSDKQAHDIGKISHNRSCGDTGSCIKRCIPSHHREYILLALRLNKKRSFQNKVATSLVQAITSMSF